MSSYVRIYHGPCNLFYTVEHKPQKLRGLRDQLLKLGYRVDLIPVEYRNVCIIEMAEYEVFRCNLCNLQFNTPYEKDHVCMHAIAAIQEASVRIERSSTYFWLWALLEDQIFKRSKYAPKEHWPFTPKLSPLKLTCKDCATCCGITIGKYPLD